MTQSLQRRIVIKAYKLHHQDFNLWIELGRFLLVMLVVLGVSLSIGANYALADSQKVERVMEKEFGIKVLAIRQSAAGYMLDFRYKVTDPEKASIFLDRGNRPSLNVIKNGSVLQVPVSSKIGPLRQSALLAKAGKNYFMFFANPGRMVKPGDKVQVIVGDYKSRTLFVE